MNLAAITHILLVAFLAAIPLNATTVSQIIAEVEKEISGKSGALLSEPVSPASGATGTEKNARCRGELRTRYSQCNTPSCKKSALTEFKFCTVSHAKINRGNAQKQAFTQAEKLRQQAVKPDACMSILRKRDVCATDEKCRSHLWKEYQACLNKFSKDGDSQKTGAEPVEKLTPEELREHEISLKRLEYEADVARAKLEKTMNEKKNRQLRKELSQKKRKLAQLARKHKKYGGDPSHVSPVSALTDKHPRGSGGKIPKAPEKAKPRKTKAKKQGAESKNPNACQAKLVGAIKKCQATYQLNPLPRFDNAHIECVRAAQTTANTCGKKAGRGTVGIPEREDLSTKSGDKPAKTPQDCDALFAKDLDKKCGTDWACRNNEQQKAWMCKALVSLPR